MQLDKSQSYNGAPGVFGFNGRPSQRTKDLLDEIGDNYGVVIKAVVQPTHCFDINACDALLHSCHKTKLRSYPATRCRDHIQRDFDRMVREVSTGRMIQRCFWRAYRRDENGDIDLSLIPQAVRDWYDSLSDEEDTFEERDSDVELD